MTGGGAAGLVIENKKGRGIKKGKQRQRDQVGCCGFKASVAAVASVMELE